MKNNTLAAIIASTVLSIIAVVVNGTVDNKFIVAMSDIAAGSAWIAIFSSKHIHAPSAA